MIESKLIDFNPTNLIKGGISSINKYFSSLSVGGGLSDSLFGKNKTMLVPVGTENETPYGDDTILQRLFSEPETSFLELDATTEMSSSYTKKAMSHAAESNEVFIDSIVREPVQLNITCFLELEQVNKMESMFEPNILVYVINYKEFAGMSRSIEFTDEATMYSILAMTITDSGYKNCVKCELRLMEVMTYDIIVEGVVDGTPKNTNKKTAVTDVKHGKEVRAKPWFSADGIMGRLF